MSIKRIKENNDISFLDDLKTATSVMVYAPKTNNYFSIQKKELRLEAEDCKIRYYMTDKIFRVGRIVMVVT